MSSRSSSYTYDPATGKWTQSTSTNNPSGSDSTTSNSGGNSNSDNLTSTTSNSDSSTGAVEQQYNEIEVNTLNGSLSFIVTKETIKLKAGDTVKLNGLGKYLSGDYYVKDITRQISSSGYSHSATLIKTDFGNSLKISTSSAKTSKATKTSTSVSSSSKASTAQRTYTVKKGDNLWKIARQYYGKGSLYTKIYEANKNKISNPSLIYPGQVFVIP